MRRLRRLALAATAVLAAAACGTSTPGNDPHVMSTSPANGELDVPSTTAIAITFDRAMQAASITDDTTDVSCSGTLQLSGDDFATCVRMATTPVASGGGLTFTAVPATPLVIGSTYRIKVTAGVASAQGRVLAHDFVTSDGFTIGSAGTPTPTATPTPGPYRHTIAVDGVNDFSNMTEKFTTTSANYFAWVTWDASNLYFALQGNDVNTATNPDTKWVVAYFGGSGGTTTGVDYDDGGLATNPQQPTLPFPAKWHVGWKADDMFTQSLVWNGSMWVSTTGMLTRQRVGTYVEFAVPISRIGTPTHVPFVMSMVNELNTHEATYAGVPRDAFTDGSDPDFAHWFDFDLTASTPPSSTPEQ